MADHQDIPPTEPVSGDDASGVLGPYHLLRRIGEGGMGEVFLAEQREPIRRRVAIKLIKAGMDTREVIARFESERQALALMDHPNIARIHDAGATEAGRPYFVMEYVAGESITSYCDQNRLSLDERLNLFIPLCEAIHHAHQKGIIHRDIKPTNVLVTEVGGAPVAKVIDFGVAKATSQPLTEKTLFTAQGQMLGTPAYMSPEQAEMTGLNVDTTSDVYSLGVLLYELLAGAQPFDSIELRKAGIAEIHRIIREVEPPRPSTRADSLGDDATTIASYRHLQPRDWVRRLRGELDWITMRAMSKERSRRYQSALDLAQDLKRHLRNEPVEAGPPDVRYRFGKFARRHRTLLGSAAAIVVVLLVAITAVSILYVGSERARADAEWNQYVAAMQLAGAAYDARSAGSLADALERCPDVHRDWGWQWLQDQLNQSDEVVWTSPCPITSAEFLLEHNLLAVGRADGVVTLLDTQRRAVVDSVRVSPDAVHRVALSPDGRRLATQNLVTDSIRVREIDSGEILLELTPPEEWACGSGIIFSSSGDELLLYGDGVRAYPLNGGAPRVIASSASLPRDPAPWNRGTCLGSAARRPGGNSITFARNDGTLFRLDAGAQALDITHRSDDPGIHVQELVAGRLHTLTYEEARGSRPRNIESDVTERRVEPWLRRLSSYSFDPEAARRTVELQDDVSAIEASDDARWSAVGAPGGVLALHDVFTAESLGSFLGHRDWILGMAVTDEDSRIITVSRDRSVMNWRVPRLLSQHRPLSNPSVSTAIAIEPGGTRYAIAGLTDAQVIDSTVNLDALPPRFSAPGHQYMLDVSWHPDGRFLVAAATDRLPFTGHGSVGRSRAVYSFGEDEPLMVTDDRPVLREPGQAAFSHDGRRLAWGFNRGEIGQMFINRDPSMAGIEAEPSEECLEIWDLDRRSVLRGFAFDATEVTALAWSADDRYLYFADGEFNVHVLRVEDGEILHSFSGHRGLVNALAGDPSGRYLASAAHDSTGRVWNLNTGEALATLHGHTKPVRDVVFAPGGRRLVTVASDETVRIWDVLRGDQITAIRVEGADGMGLQLAPHPDGRRLLLAGAMSLWELGPTK